MCYGYEDNVSLLMRDLNFSRLSGEGNTCLGIGFQRVAVRGMKHCLKWEVLHFDICTLWE